MNAVLNNGSFETVGAGGVPSGWTRPYGDASVETGPVLPVQGQRYVRLWHDGRLAQTFTVTGGVPITLRFHARAQVPQGFNELPRLADTNSQAHQAARRLARGANLGNYLEAPPGQEWGARYTAADFSTIRNEGFDHVRLPIAWHHYTGPAPDFILAATIYEKADFLVTNALARGLGRYRQR